MVLQYLRRVWGAAPPVDDIVKLYQALLAEAERTFLDGSDQRPAYSLRTLCRALTYTGRALELNYGKDRALWDAFHMSFVTQLQQKFAPAAEKLLLKHPKLKKPP